MFQSLSSHYIYQVIFEIVNIIDKNNDVLDKFTLNYSHNFYYHDLHRHFNKFCLRNTITMYMKQK